MQVLPYPYENHEEPVTMDNELEFGSDEEMELGPLDEDTQLPATFSLETEEDVDLYMY